MSSSIRLFLAALNATTIELDSSHPELPSTRDEGIGSSVSIEILAWRREMPA
jgi:hypothetical protein